MSAAFDKLDTFLGDLEQRGINYTLAHNRPEAVMVIATAPGERWEIEFFRDGSVEIEKFFSSGKIHGEKVLGELLSSYSDDESGWGATRKTRTVVSR